MKILIVEDDRRIAQTISQGLSGEGYETEVVYDGQLGREAALQNPIDMLILDINLPGLSGFSICHDVRQAKPALPILMLTALGEVEDKVLGLSRGADDYIVKPFDLRELNARVAACFRRLDRQEETVGQEVLQVADLVVNPATKQVSRHGQSIELTSKEFNLLEQLMRHPGQVISKKDLTERVWNLHFDPGTNVVEVYINYLRRKIDRNFEPKLIHTRSGYGYMIKEG
ncbi:MULTISPECIES: response regulator transcription factor [Spirosoma]|uniref:Response regulator transcription factor n=1 Tax=Spirosoma sordidisoli TaxID=2502893 RepID=A0A4Q2ULB1_9BACT|nr:MULTISPECIES: response regulator transcription factor [Spirosoma]RYC69502.1 response regulator transcription factor [Spirosoma sordidisoli]